MSLSECLVPTIFNGRSIGCFFEFLCTFSRSSLVVSFSRKLNFNIGNKYYAKKKKWNIEDEIYGLRRTIRYRISFVFIFALGTFNWLLNWLLQFEWFYFFFFSRCFLIVFYHTKLKILKFRNWIVMKICDVITDKICDS